MKAKNILITGAPGVGKTTLVGKIVAELKHLRPVGFYTGEIREGGARKGFTLTALDGRESILSHVNIISPRRVGKYGVDVAGFERFLDTLDFFSPDNRLVIIDEIGKMECFSDKFKRLVRDILDSNKFVIATIALKGDGFIAEIKAREDIVVYEISSRNRDSLQSDIIGAIESTD
ncbi:MAG: NTPase [candidate division Zixibacteria bacterium]|nr:NTPase [candidate division Zixibacteria bacterium]